jgi:hypothetical protein
MESEQMYGEKGMVPESEYLIPIGVAEIKRQAPSYDCILRKDDEGGIKGSRRTGKRKYQR